MSCADRAEVGPSEAVELFVLDGLDRDEASCIVDGIEGTVDLALATGVAPGIGEDELATLASVAAGCRTVIPDDRTVQDDGEPADRAGLPEGVGIEQAVDDHVNGLVTGGLDPRVAECTKSAVLAATDPVAALGDPNYVAEALRVCRE